MPALGNDGSQWRALSHNSNFNRRSMLKGIGLGAIAAAGIPALAACGGGGGSNSNSLTFGSSDSDKLPKEGIQAMADAFKQKDNKDVKINTVPHNDFQQNIDSYLSGGPDDSFTWFAGYRMQYYAKKGYVADLNDVWSKIGSNFSDAIAKACTGEDGKKYLVPLYNYPWGVWYRKSLWQQHGYEVPKTFDDFKSLAQKMKGDGLIPIGFSDKDGWPAMGTFDYMNMRLNGYQFHEDLCAHKESWDQKKVQDVFDLWKEVLPYQDPNALGQTWQDGAQLLSQQKTGMLVLGTQVIQEFSDADLPDLDFFPYPEIALEGQTAVEAPIDGIMVSKHGGKNQAAMDWAQFAGTPDGQNAYYSKDNTNLMVAKNADTSKYSELNKKCAAIIADAKNVSQFFDRDALPAMASNVMIPALQSFIKDGSVDLKNMESQAKQLYSAQ